MINHLLKRKVWTLLALTVLIRGALFISYPLSSSGDDNQVAQRFLIDELLRGNLLIGNVRYQTGYPLVIAPVVGIARLFGSPLDDRLVLLAQVALSSLIPFLIYTMLRRHAPTEAFIVALVVLFDPFGLQWAHFWLPEWLIALILVLALWLVNHALFVKRASLMWIGGAGFLLGIASVARLNILPAVVMFGLALLVLNSAGWRQRLARMLVLGVGSASVLLAYTVLIHYPSTGTWLLNCVTGTNLVEGALEKQMPLTATNGAATARLLNLLTLKPTREYTFTNTSYRNWRIPGAWVSDAEAQAFLSQPYGTPASELTIGFPGDLVYVLGPCPTDQLLRQVSTEAFQASPMRWLTGTLAALGRTLVQVSPLYDRLALPRYEKLTFTPGSRLPGFSDAHDANFYNGELVWTPGIRLFSMLFNGWNTFKWLTPLAVVWALFSRRWVYSLSAVVLLVCLGFIAVFDSNTEPRLYAAVYPLYSLLIGGLIVAVARRASGLRHPA